LIPSRCKSNESWLNRTTAVGLYPRGSTDQGIYDLAGNVWEWCLNAYEQPEAPESLLIDDRDVSRVIRGGSWTNSYPDTLRASFRFGYYADGRDTVIGFRLVQDID
jgi:formylglycine-generating enzyme required for sulfatase activity